jgi:predicted dehydrogenase
MASHPKAKYVAFCDVDLARTEKARKLNPAALVFQDYRELLETMGD